LTIPGPFCFGYGSTPGLGPQIGLDGTVDDVSIPFILDIKNKSNMAAKDAGEP